MATAKDGEKIPITLFYNKYWAINKKEPQKNKILLTSYGSYGSGQGVGFNTSLFPLINRGFIYAIAHIRGGNDLGEKWHLDGKMLNKKKTFTDFIACTEYLIEKEYATKGNITIQGASAGGLLMGAVANMRPELFKAVILDVPFVDVVNTMLDDKLPLTTGEYEEWGNPNDKKYYKYIKSYSPYENVAKKDYPPMFFFTGINDSRVGYWEPAKMVAKLRSFKTDKNILLLKTNLNAGHGGDSGRYSYYKSLAMKYALIFDLYKNSTTE
ncbi:MAG: S9 family peptidase [Flavobacteriales bacterium]|nr:S9 family peptidase [Flavobacteriales bacterium]